MELFDPHSELTRVVEMLGSQNEGAVFKRTHLPLIVPAGASPAYALDPNGHVVGVKFGATRAPQRLLELLSQLPYLQRLILFAKHDEPPFEIPASLADLVHLRYAVLNGKIERVPEELLRLDLPLFVGSDNEMRVSNANRAMNWLLSFDRPGDEQRALAVKEGEEPGSADEYTAFLGLAPKERGRILTESAGLAGVFLETAHLEDPPMEIAARGREAIASYFRDRGIGSLKLNEVKVLLVGNGSCGKTSLVKQLCGEKFDPGESQTHGIKITTHPLGSKRDGRIRANLWDFGGQEIMHATHQFFLSKRSLYVLVLDGRKEEDAEYWLQHIRSFGGESPVMIVLNKIDEHPSFDLNRVFYTRKYPQIVDFFRVSCATGSGINEFKNALHKQLISAAILQTSWPRAWFKVKQRLEHLGADYISMAEYNRVCDEENVTDQASKDALVDFLNDLGVILHFKDLQLLDTHVLDPRWVTEGVYRIVNSETLAEQKGLLRISQLKEVFRSSRPGSEFQYSPDKYGYIIELMLKFELCYKLDGNAILVPDLLDIQEPALEADAETALRFVLEYQYLAVVPVVRTVFADS